MVYAILLARPEGGEVTIEGITPAEDALVSMFGSGYREWSAAEGKLTITLPEEYPEAHAYAFKISKLWRGAATHSAAGFTRTF